MALRAFSTRIERVLTTVMPVSEHKHRRSRMSHRIGVERLEGRELLTTVTVDIINFAFNPDPVTIHVGDTVHWVWQASDHSTTSVNGIAESWDSNVLNAGATFDHMFTHTGSFQYYCKIHGMDNGNGTASGMSGTINVMPAATMGGSNPMAPTLLNDTPMVVGKGAKREVLGFSLVFSTALDINSAQNVANYQVTQPGATKRAHPVKVAVRTAMYIPSSDTVMLTLGKSNVKKAFNLTATGLLGSAGTPAGTIVKRL